MTHAAAEPHPSGPDATRPNPADPPEIVPWARQPSVPVARKTRRTRQVVTGLPAWEPLPPGEILVRRTDRG